VDNSKTDASFLTMSLKRVQKGEKKKRPQLVSETRYYAKRNVPVTGSGGPQGCERSRVPYFLDNRLRDGGEVVSLTRRPSFTTRKIPGTHFC
jgi:hypothetical protein